MTAILFRVMLASIIVLMFAQNTFCFQDDMEKEFLKGVAEMEGEYRRFEKAAFEEFRRTVKAMWGDFAASTKKDWVEYAEDMKARRRVDFKSGEVQVEVLVPKDTVEQNPEELDKRLAD